MASFVFQETNQFRTFSFLHSRILSPFSLILSPFQGDALAASRMQPNMRHFRRCPKHPHLSACIIP